MAQENTEIYRKFVQFDGTNWNSWKFRVGVLLDEKNLCKYIEEDFDKLLERTIDDVDEMKCILEEKKCKSILVQCISDSHLEYVQDKKRAKEMYDSLKLVFERQSVAAQLFLRKKLLTMKLEEGDDMSDHLLAFDKTVRQLKSIGATMETLDIICHLLLTLPKSFENLVTALETLDPEKLTIEFVKSRLLDENNKRGNNISIAGNGSIHSTAIYSNNNSIKCYRCNKKGHKSFECKAEKQSGNFASTHHESEDDEIEVAFCSVEQSDVKMKPKRKGKFNKKRRSIRFYIDSCATSHMVNSARCLKKLKGGMEKKISIAKNGISLNTKQKGDVEGMLKFEDRYTKCILKDVLFVKDLRCNLLSVGKMQEAGLEINFKNQAAQISYNGKVICVAPKRGSLYEVNFEIEKIKGEQPIKHRTLVKNHRFDDSSEKSDLKTHGMVIRSSLGQNNFCDTKSSIISNADDGLVQFKLGNDQLCKSIEIDYTKSTGDPPTRKLKWRNRN